MLRQIVPTGGGLECFDRLHALLLSPNRRAVVIHRHFRCPLRRGVGLGWRHFVIGGGITGMAETIDHKTLFHTTRRVRRRVMDLHRLHPGTID